MNLNRNLAVRIDGTPAAEGCRVRLQGEITLSLYPDLLTLTVWNLSDEGYHQLRRGAEQGREHGHRQIEFVIPKQLFEERAPQRFDLFLVHDDPLFLNHKDFGQLICASGYLM